MKELRNFLIILIGFTVLSQFESYSQDVDFKIDPYKILSVWTYEDVIKNYGEGENIIDSMSGQAYIAGFRYKENLLGRPCDLEFYFSDVNVSRFLARFNHPNYAILEKEDEERKQKLTDQLQNNPEPDSVLIKRLKENPVVFDSVAYLKDFLYRSDLIRKDSLRSDSIIKELSLVLGPAIKKGPTHHTEKESRYQATWIRGGYSCMLKDYRKYAELSFTISPAPESAIKEFRLNPETKLIEKLNMKVRGKSLEVSLLGIPRARGSIFFDEFFIMTKTGSGATYMDELPEERQGGCNPVFNLVDLTGDGILDVWLKINENPEGSCTKHFIYTMELMEPLLIFDPLDELVFDLEGEFQDDYQAVVMIDGAARTYIPLDKEKEEYKSLYDQSGKLNRKISIIPGCLERIEASPYETKKGSQITGYRPILGSSASDIISYVIAIWDYDSGGWELRSMEIWQE